MRHQRRPILAVLRAVLVADRYPYHEGHFKDTRAHRLPLACLIKDFVPGPAHKVAVHKLYHGPAAGKRIADAGANNGAFRNGAVEKPVIREKFRKAAVDGKGPAPVADVLAPGGQRRIRR